MWRNERVEVVQWIVDTLFTLHRSTTHSPITCTTVIMATEFLAVCVKYHQILGNPRLYGMLDCIRCEDVGPVRCLEKLAALSIVKNALNDPTKTRKLKKVLEFPKPIMFSPFLSADLPELAVFIVNNIPLEPATNPQQPQIMIRMRVFSLMISYSDTRYVCGKFPNYKSLIQRTDELMAVICKRKLAKIIVWIDNGIHDPRNVAINLYRMTSHLGCKLNRKILVPTENGWKLTMFRQPRTV